MVKTPAALLVTGTCGSGKTTVTSLLEQHGWTRISEDEIWPRLFGKNRGPFGSAEHRAKRHQVHEIVFQRVLSALAAGQRVVIDATVHEAPPEAFEEYRAFFDHHGIIWQMRILHPPLAVAVARDAGRLRGSLGAERVAELHAKLTGLVFPKSWFLDTSEQNPAETVEEILRVAAAPGFGA
ncbi:MAG TPA: AAA family ATPase [Thermoanaerobaculia bacterium]|jgi:predicted kinase|nr:AAA family ATPase [Thermoanaerobaculia bacterium]